MKFDAIIIGAGINGLVTAYRLKSLGRNVLLIESGDRAGGVIESRDADGFLIELGPNSLRGTHEFLDLVDELGLSDELVTGDPKAPAYVFAGGELHAVPMNPVSLIETRLITSRAKLRLLREPFIKARKETVEESVASFVRRRLGREILERLVAPFLSGVYAGDPEMLSIDACFPKLVGFERSAGSILRGALGSLLGGKPARSLRQYRLCSFKGGMETVVRSMSQRLGENLITGTKVTGIAKDFSGDFVVKTGRETFETSALVIAAPAFAAARLVEDLAPEISSAIVDIPYASLASVPLAYKTQQIKRPLDGFGFLAPRSEGLRTLGSIWNSTLFAGRAPAGWVCLTNFIGGATDPEAVKLSDDDLVETVHRDLSKALGISGEPRRLPITRYERAIPQYNLGHAGMVAKVYAALHNHKGLWLAGNYLRGVSLGDCIRQAENIAAEVSGDEERMRNTRKQYRER